MRGLNILTNAVTTARNPDDIQDIANKYPDNALSLSLDINNSKQITNVGKQAEAEFGSIDVLLNNAGYGYRAAVEEGEDEDILRCLILSSLAPST